MMQQDEQHGEHHSRHVLLDQQYMLHDKSMDLHNPQNHKEQACAIACDGAKKHTGTLEGSLESIAPEVVLYSAAVLRSTTFLCILSQALTHRQTLIHSQM